jgi:hypothetical protein
MQHILRAAVVLATLTVTASSAVAEPTSAAVDSALAPAGYVRVRTPPIAAPPGSYDVSGHADCPAGTVVWGGGAGFTGGVAGFGQSINTSAPTATGWQARYNNTGDTSVNFAVDVICAARPRRYAVTYATVDHEPGTQATATAVCPDRTVLLSGGALSSATTTNVYLLSAFPATQHSYQAVEWNGSSTAQRLAVFAICARKPDGYTIVTHAAYDRGLDTLVAGAACPASSSIIGGGIRVLNPNPSVTLGASLDDPETQWLSEVVNWTASPVVVTTYAICAA